MVAYLSVYMTEGSECAWWHHGPQCPCGCDGELGRRQDANKEGCQCVACRTKRRLNQRAALMTTN